MIDRTLPQLACVEQPFGCPPPKVFCPMCGQAINDFDLGDINPCPHLAFLYLFSCSEFQYQSEDFIERTKSFELERIPINNSVQYLTRAGYSNNLLVLEITFGGMANGPSWTTDLYGFDFETLIEHPVPID